MSSYSIGKASPLFFKASVSGQPDQIKRQQQRGRAQNAKCFSTLFFTTDRSANNIVKTYTAKIQEDGIGNGQAASNTFEEKYNSSPTREAKRASHELF